MYMYSIHLNNQYTCTQHYITVPCFSVLFQALQYVAANMKIEWILGGLYMYM